MIRAETREECAYFITCLNRAAQLKIEHLWDYASGTEFGRGRYAAVFPARRRTEYPGLAYDESLVNNNSKTMDKQAALAQYNCALKVIDKAQFWHRVVKGRERADTLVRETSVQATLTAKCGKIATFLKLRGFFETSEHFVIELELLEGTDLFQHISSKGTLPEHEAAMILRDMLTSLEAMNRVGLAHRDIKPANVLMCDRKKDGVSVKVGDFGMSTFVGVDGLVRGRCGTPGYVAPEILTGGSRIGYSNAVDVFSAGVTLYVMLCGYEPFYGENEKDLIEANKRAVVEFPDEDWARISNDARNLILSMTHPDPKRRISARDALRHPWITRLDGGNEMDKPTDSNTLNPSSAPRIDDPMESACIIS
jgi:serine/threonine protein kinase